ncbi:Piso0_002061 [Millerozyma farinosa CBS 7064]|uniref:Piso0_002061 protein n=1 Tax=Pichia sorbitophila (strain ATCC MYA-4447 / BCRC 22081 / CBS 7064 / NBRC 10061 / NRRL Y-12695) TaxID=559304 RepID=G8YBK9_PICSO|nr:Piso0_002061 [Millerozyma farinosa CBS 7064]
MRHCAIGTYKNTCILKLILKFILQLGDPTNTGKHSEPADAENPIKVSKKDYKPSSVGESDISRGTVFAVKNPNREDRLGSQFFICLDESYSEALKDTEKYVKLGKVVEGLEAIRVIETELSGQNKLSSKGRPKGKWKVEPWVQDVVIHYNPFAHCSDT